MNRIQEAIASIRALLDREASNDPEDRRKAAIAIATFRQACPTSVTEKITELDEWLRIYISPKKPYDYQGGPQQIRVWIIGCLSAIERAYEKTDDSAQPADRGEPPQ